VSLGQKVAGLVIEDVFQIKPESSARDAAQMMLEKDVGSLLVAGAGLPMGIVTDKDILRKVTAAGRSPDRVTVRDIMSFPLVAVTAEATVGEAVEKMVENKIKRLAVTTGEGAFVGLLTMTDIVGWMAKQRQLSDSIMDYFLYDTP